MSRPCPLRHRWRDAFIAATDDPAIDAYALVVGMAVYSHMSHDGTACVGLRRLAALSRTTVPTVRARLARLVEAGWLEATTVPGARGCYRATFPAGGGGPGAGVDDPEAVQPDAVDDRGEPGEGVQPEPEAVQPDDGGRATGYTTFTETPVTPTPLPPTGRSRRRRRSRPPSSRGRLGHDPSVGRPPPDRPPVAVGGLFERGDGTLWVDLGAAA